jgi:Tol biopolymer transport system component
MTITSGTRLGSYEVVAQIGAGGMGEVYKAHDTKLGRNVAIKVLPEAFAHDAERLARFQREAKMLAALNHPNIATIYGLEHSNSTHFLIMELVSGETLAERIKREGAVPVEEALKIAVQIAEALEAAHEKGIIHRDLKPANVKLTPEGKVKVLDFGLARAFADGTADDDPSNSPTLSMAATMHGVILGTAAYMSPEQARGKEADKRTDIWAFGCVLYELLTGKQAFEGETVTEILASVLRGDPEWQTLPSTTPVSIRSLLRRCLQKDKTLRMQSAGDIRIEIQEALATPLTASMVAAIPRPTLRRWVLISGLTCLIVAAIVGLAVWNLKPPALPPAPVSRWVFSLPAGDRLARFDLPLMALSPDGRHMVYAASRGNTQQLYLHAMDSFEAKPIAGTDGAVAPFFSPDGQWIGFFADAKLKKVSINGGAAVSLASTPVNVQATSASWGIDDSIVYQNLVAGGLSQISAGGTPKRLSTLTKAETGNRWPVFLPARSALLFASSLAGGWIAPEVDLYRLDTGERHFLISGTRPNYSPTGHLLYVQASTLMAVPFDIKQMKITGAPIPMVEGLLQSVSNGMAQYSVSENGSLAYITGGMQASQSRLVWVSRNGAEQPLPAPPHAYQTPRLSPDGKRVAVVLNDLGGDVWIYDIGRDALTRLTFESGGATVVAWTRDGKRVAFNTGSPAGMFWQAADGSGKAERLTTSENQQNPSSWSPDGQALVYMDNDPTTSWDVWVLRFSDRKAQPFLRTSAYEGGAQFSPDGRWLTYVSDESGRLEVYVQPYPGPGGKWQISTEGGTQPVWNPNGRELFYRSSDKMMAVDITTQPNFTVGKPKMLFEGAYLSLLGTSPSYDVSPDGQRFLMLKGESTQSITQINIVQNWFEDLKRRVPPGK